MTFLWSLLHFWEKNSGASRHFTKSPHAGRRFFLGRKLHHATSLTVGLEIERHHAGIKIMEKICNSEIGVCGVEL